MELLRYALILNLLLMFTHIDGNYGDPVVTNTKWISPSVNSDYGNSIIKVIDKDKKALGMVKMCVEQNTRADCSNCNLTFVPTYLDSNITFLDLSINQIESLGNILSKYFNLKNLNLSNNLLRVLNNKNFVNLSKLLELDLHNNNLTMPSAYPVSVFRPLRSLTVLKIYRNNHIFHPGLDYPDQALSVLQNLTHLYMDALMNKTMGSGFRNLTSLTHLTLKGPRDSEHCTPVMVAKETFNNVPQLVFLNLSGCCLNGQLMEPGVFLPLTSLQTLDISRNEQRCLNDLVPVLQDLQKSNVRHLEMTNVVNPYAPCVVVSTIFAESLPRRLTSLVARSNSIEIVEKDVIASLPKTLTRLDIGDNRFTFGDYLKNFSNLGNLTTLNLDGGTFSFSLPTDFPEINGNCSQSYNSRKTVKSTAHITNRTALLKLPKYIENVSIEYAEWSFSFTRFEVDPNNSMKRLSLNGNNIPKLVGPVTGLEGLTELDLVQCNIYFISETFFHSFPSLVTLNLSSNFFGALSLSTNDSPLFKQLSYLRILDLSFNNILTINGQAFDGLVNLRKLWLNNNAFYYFNVNISDLKSLEFIDFRFTELSTLEPYTIEALNKISQDDKHNLSIDFSETPISCFCENLYFLDWLVKFSKEKTFKNYKCVFADTSEKYTDINEFEGIYNQLKKECTPKFELFIAIVAATVLMIILIICSIVYRFRWKLRYLYYSAYISLKFKDEQAGKGDYFQYDVFTSYVSDDQEFVMETLLPQLRSRGLKVHVHAKDFVAGEYITSNIVNAIQSSRHTLVVLTRQLLKSTWCNYELQMANMETVHTGRSVLVFLLMENLTKKELGTELLYHIQSSTYIKYPEAEFHQSENEMEVFWKKLVSDLRS